jgi:hypothetical protein
MATFMNRPDKLTVDSFSDPTLDTFATNGYFSQFTNQLNTPLLDVKGIQLLRANFVNPSLPLNDFNGQLFFIYSRNTTTTIPLDGSTIKIIRLHPSWYVPATSYTTYVKNKYYNNGTELVTDLNLAAAVGGDLATYNPNWVGGDVTFSFSTATRRISFTGNNATYYYAPLAADHPAVAAYLAASAPKMYSLGNVASYAGAMPQPYRIGTTMNSRLGFGLTYNNRSTFASASWVPGCATSIGIAQANGIAVEADSFPIMLGTQNINVYCSVINGSGNDSGLKKNLLATLPIENTPISVNSYTLTSVEKPAKSVAREIYSLVFDFTDDAGNPLFFYTNMNINLELNIYY